jgi:amino acid transporter
MPTPAPPITASQTALRRSLGFWEATAINITQIVGAGVFATIPLILGVLPGAYALLAWLAAGVLILADSMIWGELGAALPAAGGSYHFLLESFGRLRWGRLMSFLFVWQILISGPLEIGSGLVLAAQFSTAIHPDVKAFDDAHSWTFEVAIPDGKTIGVTFGPSRLFGFALGVVMLVLLCRRVTTLGRLSLLFAAGVVGVIVWVLVEGALRFDPVRAFGGSFEPGEKPEDPGMALGAGMAFAIYSYFGYYNICYLGGEVRDPARTIPRSILVSALAVVVLFALVHIAIVGVIPWREARSDAYKDNLTAEFMARVRGQWAAAAVTVCLVGSCFASAFSGMLGYSRVPFAAAREGHFFRWFGELHARHHIPHRALALIGGMVLLWSFFSLDAIISALIATRILEQFVAQAFAVMILRRRSVHLPWRMYLYPLPCLMALCGWLFVYCTTGALYIAIGLSTLLLGVGVFLGWSRLSGQWPFERGRTAGT